MGSPALDVIDPDSGRLQPIAAELADFAHELRLDRVPSEVRERARHSILDGVGVALAAGPFEFARRATRAIVSLSDPGSTPVIGLSPRMQMRDAAFLNGVLIHGLDFDDTHLQSAIHPTASLLPTILAVGWRLGSSGGAMLEAYIVGLEADARLGMFGGVRLREAGSHPTSSIGIFGCALAAGRLLGLAPVELVMAQGIALSMASGRVGSPADGPSNKRLHPGWAAQSAITAAFLAEAGVVGPNKPYEGVRGLFADFNQREVSNFDGLAALLANLGTVWESANISVKPIPACHLAHACSDAAVALRVRYAFAVSDIRQVTALVPKGVIQAVCEPLELRRRPATSHAAQFSIPYIVAASLTRGTFGLAELEPAAISDAEILALASRVNYAIDEQSTYPVHRTGELIVELNDGTILRHREAINRGAPDRPLTLGDIESKFRANASLALGQAQVDAVAVAVLGMESATDGRALIGAMCADSAGHQGAAA